MKYKALVRKDNQTQIVEKEIPTILEKNYLLIKVDLAGICRTDIHVSEGLIDTSDGLVLGHEFSGFVFKSNSDKFLEGDYVAINPIFEDYSMLGLEHDGCFAEYIVVSEEQVFLIPKLNDPRIAAYIEPLAASLAPLKSKFITKEMKGSIYGENRIGYLTYSIMKNQGYDVEIISSSSSIEDNTFDYIIETLPTKTTFDNIPKILKKNGILIIKSRLRQHIEINLYEYLKKEIIMESLYYHDFNFAIEYAINNYNDFNNIFGNIYSIEDWQLAFKESVNGEKKIFIKL